MEESYSNTSVSTTLPFDNVTTGEDILVPSFFTYGNGAHALVSMYLLFLAVIGCGANGAVLFLFIKNKHLRNPMNLIFANLSLSDFIVSLGVTFVQFLSSAFRLYAVAGSIACDTYGFVAFLGGEASLIALMVIAVERFMTVVRPFNIGNLTYRGATVAIVFVWAFSAVWAVGPMIGWSSYIPEGLGTWCSINWTSNSVSNQSYVMGVFVMSYIIPIGIIIWSYGFVWWKVREMAQSSSATESSMKAEKAIARMSCIMVTLFVFAWTPYAIVAMTASYGPPGFITNDIAIFPSLFAKSSCIYNPVIYIGMNKGFRHAFFMSILGRDPFEKKKEDESTVGNTTVGGGGNKVAPAP